MEHGTIRGAAGDSQIVKGTDARPRNQVCSVDSGTQQGQQRTHRSKVTQSELYFRWVSKEVGLKAEMEAVEFW